MQKIDCLFCGKKYELVWMRIPDSIEECCPDAALRKKIYKADPDDLTDPYRWWMNSSRMFRFPRPQEWLSEVSLVGCTTSI